MNDDLRLSLYMDGRLPEEELSAFERRLEAEPPLRARLDAMRRLQALSAGLAPVSAAFSADDVRVRAEFAPRFGLGRRREVEPCLVMLVDPQPVGPVALKRVPSGEVEEVLDRPQRPAHPVPREQILVPGRSEELAQSFLAKVERPAARAPVSRCSGSTASARRSSRH